MPLLDARFFVTAVLTQRESGGNLSEVLDNLATMIRERFRVKRQVRVISAHGRITGWVLVRAAAGRWRCSSHSRIRMATGRSTPIRWECSSLAARYSSRWSASSLFERSSEIEY